MSDSGAKISLNVIILKTKKQNNKKMTNKQKQIHQQRMVNKQETGLKATGL